MCSEYMTCLHVCTWRVFPSGVLHVCVTCENGLCMFCGYMCRVFFECLCRVYCLSVCVTCLGSVTVACVCGNGICIGVWRLYDVYV